MRVDRTEQQMVVDRFLGAVRTGDVQGLLDVLAPEVILVSDGGGVVPAFGGEGAQRVASLLAAAARFRPGVEVAAVWLNGAPAGRFDPGGELNTAVSLVIEDGRIARIYAIRNPHKLSRLDAETALAR
jgi:RNA polymerase sigma-70 factor (ECF subfamily)